MNKILRGVVIAIPLLFLMMGNVYAGLFGHGSEDEVKTIVVVGTSGIVSSFSDSNRILGFTVTGTANAVVGFYDYDGFIAEGGCLANDMKTVWFPFPKEVTTKLEVLVNAATTIVTIYYE